MPNSPSPRASEQRGIQSIEVGGALLQALADHGSPMMLKDLAAAANMPAAKAHPYLVSFVKLGLAEQDARTGRYRLGPFALQLGLSALRGLDPVRIATQQAALLADESQLSIAVAVWGNFGPTVIHIEEGQRPIHVNMRPGTVLMPLLLSATGRVFAAFMPGRTIEPLLRRETQPVHGDGNGNGDGDASAHTTASARPTLAAFAHAAAAGHTPDPARGMRTWAQAQALLEEIRTQRLARAMGSPIPGVNAFSAPVHDASGQLALTITAMGAADDFDTAWDSPIAQRLRACAREIEYRLGAPDPAGGAGPSA